MKSSNPCARWGRYGRTFLALERDTEGLLADIVRGGQEWT